ncbi:hypothetical protein [Dolichospermum phage Dfl-JY23]
MTYLNIETETENYSIEIPKYIAKRSESDIWYGIETQIENLDEVVDYKKSKKAKYETIVKVNVDEIRKAIRAEIILKRPRKVGEI